MSDETRHALIICTLVFCLVILVALLFLEPVFGLLWLALVMVCCIVIHLVKPQIWQKEKERWHAKRAERKAKKSYDPDRYQTDFKPDHMLICLDSGNEAQYLIDSADFVIGRGYDCNLVLNRGNTIGTRHCRILFRRYSHAYYIEDLRSLNGTYLGTKRLEPFKQEKLLDGMELSISHYRYQFVRRQE